MAITLRTFTAARQRCLLVACCAAASVAIARRARAAEPAVAGSIWVGSQDALTAAAAQVGLPLPAMVNVSLLEQVLRGPKPGDIRTDAPVGLLFISGDDFANKQEQFGIAAPLKPGTAALGEMYPDGAKPDAAGVVAVAEGGPYVRRAQDYLVFGFDAPAVSKLDVAKLSGAMRPTPDRGRTPVLSLSFDMAAFRASAPKQYAAMIAQAAAQAAREPDPSRRAGADFARGLYDKLGTVALGIDQTHDGWDTTVSIQPFPTAHSAFARPGLPADCVARADVQVPADALASLIKAIPSTPGSTPAAEMPVATKMLTTLFAGDAETIGLGMTGEQPAIYCVTQRKVPGDLAAEVAALKADSAALPAADAEGYSATPYTGADGQPVYRFTDHEHGRLAGYIDVTQRGPLRFVTFSPTDGHLVEALVALPREQGSFDTLAEGWVKPGPMLNTVAALAAISGQGDGVPAERRKQLAQLLGDARVSWTSRTEGSGAAFTASVPTALLKAIAPAVGLVGDPTQPRTLSGPVGVQERQP